MNKILSILNLFRKGYVVANPEAWKKGQITVDVLATVLVASVAVAKAFGIEIPLTDEQALNIAVAVLTIVGLSSGITTVVSSDKVGVLPINTDSEQPNPLTGQPD